MLPPGTNNPLAAEVVADHAADPILFDEVGELLGGGHGIEGMGAERHVLATHAIDHKAALVAVPNGDAIGVAAPGAGVDETFVDHAALRRQFQRSPMVD